MAKTKDQPLTPFDYKLAASNILRTLKKDRDRQVIARRFGLDLAKRQTLEKIGQDFGITRERVRQIEKAALAKLSAAGLQEVSQANKTLASYLDNEGGLMAIDRLADKMEADTPQEKAYIQFLATLSPDIHTIDETEQLRAAAATGKFTAAQIRQLAKELAETVSEHGQPASIKTLADKLPSGLPVSAVGNLAEITKELTSFENKWGLLSWPEVNPRSIRDRSYLALRKHGKPLHFSDISEHIVRVHPEGRKVTIQAVHNELIKDPRFILIGRGIYALSDWGYTPGTVADIIVEILKEESPLHKDEVVRRVLMRRQVKTTTIILNLQEKEQFERVAKATYRLKQSP